MYIFKTEFFSEQIINIYLLLKRLITLFIFWTGYKP